MSERLAELLAGIEPPDETARAACHRALDAKTKPRRSLGRLETLAEQLAALAGRPAPPVPEAAIVVAAADHGVTARGVSAYPSEVTAQMVANFAAGGAAINVLARRAGARLVVVDAGVASPTDAASVRPLRFGAGTADIAAGPAMSETTAVEALLAGAAIARELAADGVGLVGIGEMGIGNSTSAAAIAAALLGVDPAATVGPGTGLDPEGVRHKVEVVRQALTANSAAGGDPLATLAALGGFEIAVLAGVALGCAARAHPGRPRRLHHGRRRARRRPPRAALGRGDGRVSPLHRARPHADPPGARARASARPRAAPRRGHRSRARDPDRAERRLRSSTRWRASRRRA